MCTQPEKDAIKRKHLKCDFTPHQRRHYLCLSLHRKQMCDGLYSCKVKKPDRHSKSAKVQTYIITYLLPSRQMSLPSSASTQNMEATAPVGGNAKCLIPRARSTDNFLSDLFENALAITISPDPRHLNSTSFI